MMKKLFLYLLMSFTLLSCGGNEEIEPLTEENNEYKELDERARQLFTALPDNAENAANPLNDAKIALGKKLYFDKRLSKDNKQSCNTCHNLNTFGVDNEALSEGNDGELGGRNSPTTLNAALHLAQFWDGREPDVEAQAGGPILNPVEMAMPNEKSVVQRLSAIPEYVDLFAKAFPSEKSPITYNNLKKAIGAFERKLITPSRFDTYLAGDNKALSIAEKKGLQTFMDAGCITCHSGALLGGMMYQKFGLYGNYWEHTKSQKIDNGKFELTKNESDKYVFKVPSLRNIEKTGPFFHDGSITDLGDAVKIMAKLQSNKELSESEVNDILTFLKTLTGEVPADLKE